MSWNTESVRATSRPATVITTMAVSQPVIQAAALRSDRVSTGMPTFWPTPGRHWRPACEER